MRLFVTLFGYNGVGLATNRPDPPFWRWKDLSGRIFDDALDRRWFQGQPKILERIDL